MDVSELGAYPTPMAMFIVEKGLIQWQWRYIFFSDRPKCLGLSMSPTFWVFTILLNDQDLIFEQVGFVLIFYDIGNPSFRAHFSD